MLKANPKPVHFILSPHPVWGAPLDNTAAPRVEATLWVLADCLRVRWEVHDSVDTFRCEVSDYGGPVWQDSCV